MSTDRLWKCLESGDLCEFNEIQMNDSNLLKELATSRKEETGPYPLEYLTLSALRILRRSRSHDEDFSRWIEFLRSVYKVGYDVSVSSDSLSFWDEGEEETWKQCARYIQHLYPFLQELITLNQNREIPNRNGNLRSSIPLVAQCVHTPSLKNLLEYCKPVDSSFLNDALYKV